METWIPKPGDGIIDDQDRHSVVLSVSTVGSWAEHSPDPNDSEDDLVSVTANYRGTKIEVPAGRFRQETFFEHLTRPTGYGRIAWPIAIVIFVFSAVFVALGFGLPDAKAVSLGFGFGVPIVTTFGCWMNYTRRWL